MIAVKDAGTRPAPTLTNTTSTGPRDSVPAAKELAWQFAETLADQLALRVELGYGVAHVNRDVAAASDFNVIRIHAPASAATLAAHAAELFPSGPRHLAIRDDATAVPLLPALVAAGYEPRRIVVLTPDRPGGRPRTDLSVRPAGRRNPATIDGEDAELDTAYWAARHRELTPEQIAQVRLGDVLRSQVAATARMTVWAPERCRDCHGAASRAMVTSLGGVSEVGRVYTATGHRRRGFATAAVHAALHRAAGTTRFARVDAADPVQPVLISAGLAPATSWWELTKPA